MGIKVYKPTTNGRRNMTSLDFAEITTSTPEKSLLVSLKNKAGRNNNGRITVRDFSGDGAELPVYDIYGRAVSEPVRGQLYIRGGKKFMAE